MGFFRFRKSIKLLPGVRLNFNTKSMSITAGFKGYHVTVNSKGGVSQTVSVPGLGLSYTDRSSGRPRLTPEQREFIRQKKAESRALDRFIRENARKYEKKQAALERAQRLTKRENDILDILKGITYHILPSDEISHVKNEFFLCFYYRIESCWICRIVLKGRQKFIIFPIEDGKTRMYEFKKLEDIYNYSDLIKWSVERAKGLKYTKSQATVDKIIENTNRTKGRQKGTEIVRDILSTLLK